MGTIAIAQITWRRLREPATIFLTILGCVMGYATAGANAFGSDAASAAPQGPLPATEPLLLGTILAAMLGSLVTIFTAASDIPRDISTRMVAIYLSKPLSRRQYLLGKFLGALGLSGFCCILWVTTMLIVRGVSSEESGALTVGLAARQYLALLLLVPVAGIATGISCYFADIVAMIVTGLYLTLCFLLALLPVLINVLGHLIVGKLLLIVYFLGPNLAFFLRGYHSPALNLYLALYAVASAGIFLYIGDLALGKGDVF